MKPFLSKTTLLWRGKLKGRLATAVLVVTLALLCIPSLLAGCGGTSNPSKLSNNSARQMILQDGKEVRTYLAKAEDTVRLKASSIRHRDEELQALAKKYAVFSPGVLDDQVKPADWSKVVEASRAAGKPSISTLLEKKVSTSRCASRRPTS
jgi:hypothetical protein